MITAHLLTVMILIAAIGQPLVGGGALVGAITDDQGFPVTNTSVRAYRAGYDDNGNLMVLPEEAKEPHTALTDSRGVFRISELEAGEYFVAIEPTTPQTERAMEKRVPTTTYYPGTLDPSAAVTVRVRDAEEQIRQVQKATLNSLHNSITKIIPSIRCSTVSSSPMATTRFQQRRSMTTPLRSRETT